ncbi:hypothetical protein Dvina_43900 [Dactylosporangium vinaceum]|uniref:Serpin family protein n=1 Tax=Dactylosporangium vinaceum TaxID=53362 RepID=A0ABV5MGV1_9ACTN|nr:serpin family protein [Dactylosporangium vinaceum]UAB94949.1 hypothetical protein Dvina_43900 [Dactylosporangium vinaceum]
MSVAAANRLTARWAARLTSDEGTVLSGAGAYPLLARLAGFADGAAAAELGAVAPTPLELPAVVQAALGLWARADLTLQPGGQELVAGVLTDDRAPLDAWACEHTGGLIPTMPIELDKRTRLVLAAALAVETLWVEPFEEDEAYFTGPWEGRLANLLFREARTPEGLAVLDTAVGAVTTATVRGRDDVDVVLLLGEEDRGPGALLPAVIAALPALDSTPFRLHGPGITVRRHFEPGYRLKVPQFAVQAEHDLLAAADVFGLRAAADPSRGHFPGLAVEPLAVTAAVQAATAAFSATGFKAAAVIVDGIGYGMDPPHETVHVCFDRPFGFLAVHRPTGLVLFAGWVAEPAEGDYRSV